MEDLMATVQSLPNSRLLVEEEEPQETASPSTKSQTGSEAQAVWSAVSVGLRLLSQRALVALGHGVALVVLSIAALLWYRVMDNPTTQQLIGLGIYAVFGLAVIAIRGR
jgi:hypothetical protein